MQASIDQWLDSMADGIADRRDLLSVVLPRLAPEALVVALATERLLQRHAEELLQVELEEKIGTSRCDLVVRTKDQELCVEFKCLWAPNVSEFVAGVSRDIEKLRNAKHACVFGFAYNATPDGWSSRYNSSSSVENAITDAADRLRRTAPTWDFLDLRAFEFTGHGASGQVRLAVWRPHAASA